MHDSATPFSLAALTTPLLGTGAGCWPPHKEQEGKEIIHVGPTDLMTSDCAVAAVYLARLDIYAKHVCSHLAAFLSLLHCLSVDWHTCLHVDVACLLIDFTVQ